jgi:alkylated DNA repair dioxygenase AlkB
MGSDVDLFGEVAQRPVPALPGLRSWDEVISLEEEAALIAQIDASDLTPFRFQGWLGKRLTSSFGWTYNFDRGRMETGLPMPDWLAPLSKVAAKATDIPSDRFMQALVTRYDPGAGIGWHRDRPVFGQVVGFSLGNPAILRFRRRTARGFDRHAHHVAPRSLYLLEGEARHDWEHSIAPMECPRWSITLRTLAAGRDQSL